MGTCSWAVTLSVATHLNGLVSDERFPTGKGQRKRGLMMKYTDCPLIDWGGGPLIVLDVMWMTSQDTEYRFITCSSPVVHHQVNHQ